MMAPFYFTSIYNNFHVYLECANTANKYLFIYIILRLLTRKSFYPILHLDDYLNERGDVMGFQETFKALSDPTRREIVHLLKDGKMTAGDIVSHFSSTNATISHHLSILKKAGLILDEKKGKYIYYELNTSVIDEIIGWVSSLKGDGEK